MSLVARPHGVRGAVTAALVLLAALTGCSDDGAPSPESTPSASKTSAPPKQGTSRITVENFTFKPATLTVAPGTKVTVVNDDSTTHTATAAGDDATFDTGEIPAGESGSFTAPTRPGTYPYTCTIHPSMKATLTVE